MILAVANTKGGVGKSTLAILLAVEAARRGRQVWLVDGDRQGTAQAALTARGEREPMIPAACYPDGQTLRRQVQAHHRAHGEGVTIIDVGGRDSSALRAALVLSDTVLVPFQPRSFDVWGLDDMAELVDEARGIAELEAVTLLNGADPQGQDNTEAAAVAGEHEAFQHLSISIGRRKAFASAAGQGLSVGELPARQRDPKAEAEMAALYDMIMV